MLDGRFDPALALMLTEGEADASDSPHPLVILAVAAGAILAAAVICLGLLGA